jgi:lipoate-protein ligase A
MTGLSTCRLIVDPPASGPWNMAVDEALLAAAAGADTATLRLYQWSEPTLSLGYFQRYEDRQQHAASRNAAVVRRSSGGGAILHDRELTYSLAVPERLVPDPHQLYLQVHRAIIDVINRLTGDPCAGWSLRLCDRDRPRPESGEPFLCFERRAQGDVLLDHAGETTGAAHPTAEWKIAGSAQRRRRGAILQHGSLLLGRSSAAPELPGLGELTGQVLAVDLLQRELPTAVGATLNVEVREARLPAEIRTAAAGFESAKYATHEWARRR